MKSNRHYGYFSKGIDAIPHLSVLLNAPCIHLKNDTEVHKITHVVGWGLKPSSHQARIYAEENSLPYISIEDGFLRSLGLGVEGALLHSLVVDFSGIYYDARVSSDLESFILTAHTLPPSSISRAKAAIQTIRSERLSKYNHAPECVIPATNKAYRVLVVDQTLGDSSIEYGLASADSFDQMLRDAVHSHPDAEILVKVHPDVLAGKKKGYLLDLAKALNCNLLMDAVNPWSIFDQVEDVYVVTSQLGFEALMAGCRVHCYGMPFYAGWGLTHDHVTLSRRQVKRSLEQIFYASYIQYCRYVNPYTGQACELEDTLQLVSAQKNQREKFSGSWAALGFSKWKKAFVPSFLGSNSDVYFADVDSKIPDSGNLLVWSSKVTDEVLQHCQLNPVKLWRMEDGFIRSAGLGVNLVPPLSLVLDSRGIYYDATQLSDLEWILQNHSFDSDLLCRAEKLVELILEYGVSKYNVGNSDVHLSLPSDKRVILVPGQVETDASILKGSPNWKTNIQLIQQVRKNNPEAYIIYKPHPDVVAGGRMAITHHHDAASFYDLLVTNINMSELLGQVDEVHTLTSLTGFEALLRGVSVTTYGMPFYAGWGLTRDHLLCERRNRKLSLEQLVAATLILYPTYIDPVSGDVITPETALELLYRQRGKVQGPSLRTRCIRRLKRFLRFA